jgi:hypothetical protein
MKFEGIKDDVKTMIVGEHIDVNIKKYLNTMSKMIKVMPKRFGIVNNSKIL